MNGPSDSIPPDKAVRAGSRGRNVSRRLLESLEQAGGAKKGASAPKPSNVAINSSSGDATAPPSAKPKRKVSKTNGTTGEKPRAAVSTTSNTSKVAAICTAATATSATATVTTKNPRSKGAKTNPTVRIRLPTAASQGITSLVVDDAPMMGNTTAKAATGTATATATAPRTKTATTLPTPAMANATANAGTLTASLPQCDWAKRPGSRVCFSVYGDSTLVKCCRSNCNVTFHHGCQAMWECDNDAESDGCLKLCRHHHPHYSMKQSAAAKSTPATTMHSTAVQDLATTMTELFPTATGTVTELLPADTLHTHQSPAISELTGGASALLVPTLPQFDFVGTAADQGGKGSAVEDADGSDVDGDADDCVENNIDDNVDDECNEHDDNVGDSDEDGDELQYHILVAELEESDDDGMGDDDDEEEVCGSQTAPTVLKGSPPGWFPPQPPADFKYEPKFDAPTTEEDIDNPGKWPLFSFGPRYNQSKKEYIGHFTPTGAQVVPADDDGFRLKEGWEFHYNGWTTDDFDDDTYMRSGAIEGNLKPQSRGGFLDVDVLTKHGLTADRVKRDPLFFLQMLLPIMPPSDSDIANDHRIPYFSNAAIFSNIYANKMGLGIGIGHDWKSVSIEEMVRWTAVPIRHGALEGSPGMLRFRWKDGDARGSKEIQDGITHARYLQIKQNFKLNDNADEIPRGKEGYDPCAKFDYIIKCLVHNMNYCTGKADEDQTFDETTWGFAGYSAEAGGRLKNKPVSKGGFISYASSYPYLFLVLINLTIMMSSFLNQQGGQTTISIDIHRRYPRAYIHRHSLQTTRTRPPGFGQQGPSEVIHLVTELSKMIEGYKDDDGKPAAVDVRNLAGRLAGREFYSVPVKILFKKPPHITADNHFSGDHVMDYIGQKGFGITVTCRRDRLPAGLKPYLHHEKKDSTDARAKVMRYQNPICCIKQVATSGLGEAYTKTLVSFQSTGSTNIAGVNNLPSLSLYVSEKSRGRGKNKRKWGVEMNEAREIYLKHYSGVDAADHMIKNAGIRFISRKYWHAPYLHILSLAVVASYDMYQECCDGELNEDWRIPEKERMSFSSFRLLLSEQMLAYSPLNKRYCGDHRFRGNTKLTKKRRRASDMSESSYPDIGVTLENLEVARQSRLCEESPRMRSHFTNIVKANNAKPCEVCGRDCRYICTLCMKHMCTNPGKSWNGAQCAFLYHSEEFFGLSRSDYNAVQGKTDLSRWIPPSIDMITRNARYIKGITARKDGAT